MFQKAPMPLQARQGRGSGLTPRGEALLGIAGLAAIVIAWQIATSTGMLSPNAVPMPGKVVAAFGQLIVNGEFWSALASTVSIALLGVALVLIAGIPLAMAIHTSSFFRESTWLPVEFLKPIPPVALIPLILLLWGPTPAVELFLVVFASLWPMLTQLVYGLREISGTALDVARVYRYSPWQRGTRIVIPSLTPFAMTGLRISVTMALVVAIVTEYIVGIPGLGALLSARQVNGVLDGMYALIIAMGLLGIAFNGGLALLAKRTLFWHASQREKVSA